MAARHHTDIAADALLGLLERRAPRPLSIPEIVRLLDLEQYDHKQLKAALEAQVASRKLRRIGKTRYQWIRDFERAPRGEKGDASRSRRPIVKGETPPFAAGEAKRGRGAFRGHVEGRYSRVRAGYGFVEVLGRAAERFARDILIPAGIEGAALHGDRV